MAKQKLQIYHGTTSADTHKIIAEGTTPPHGVCLNIFDGYESIKKPLEGLEKLGLKVFIDNGSFERFDAFLHHKISEKEYYSEKTTIDYFKYITEQYAMLFHGSKHPEKLIITLPEVIANAEMTQQLQKQYLPIYKKLQDVFKFEMIISMQFNPHAPDWIKQMQGSAKALAKMVKPADEDGARVGVPFGNDFRTIQKADTFEYINKEFKRGEALEGRTAHLFASGTPDKMKHFGKPWVESVDASSLNLWARDAHFFSKLEEGVIDVRDMKGIPKMKKTYCKKHDLIITEKEIVKRYEYDENGNIVRTKSGRAKYEELKFPIRDKKGNPLPKSHEPGKCFCGEPLEWTPDQIKTSKDNIPNIRKAMLKEGIVMEDWYSNEKTHWTTRFKINLDNFNHVMMNLNRPNACKKNQASMSLTHGIRTEKQLLALLKQQGITDGKSQLKRGIKIETEHTDDPRKARRIAMDHLTEFGTYYRIKTGLPALEARLEKKQNKTTPPVSSTWKYIVRSPNGLIFNMDDLRKRLENSNLYIVKINETLGNNNWIYVLSVKIRPADPVKLKRVEESIDKFITDHVENNGKKSIIVQASRSGDELLFIIEDGIAFLIDHSLDNPLKD